MQVTFVLSFADRVLKLLALGIRGGHHGDNEPLAEKDAAPRLVIEALRDQLVHALDNALGIAAAVDQDVPDALADLGRAVVIAVVAVDGAVEVERGKVLQEFLVGELAIELRTEAAECEHAEGTLARAGPEQLGEPFWPGDVEDSRAFLSEAVVFRSEPQRGGLDDATAAHSTEPFLRSLRGVEKKSGQHGGCRDPVPWEMVEKYLQVLLGEEHVIRCTDYHRS